MADHIDRDRIRAFPIRASHHDEEHADPHFINGIETVMEWIESLPTVDTKEIARRATNERRKPMRLTLKDARRRALLTQEDVAGRLGVSKSAYRWYERNPGKMRVDVAYRFAEIVGLTIDDLTFTKERER